MRKPFVFFLIMNLMSFVAGFAGSANEVETMRPGCATTHDSHSPPNYWKQFFNGSNEPNDIIIKRMADAGVTDIQYFEQKGRGGPFEHPTKVKNAVSLNGYGLPDLAGRDLVKEVLEESAKYNIKVWITWTTPDKGPVFGLNNPELIKLYLDEIDEIARLYGAYKSLAGFFWHEVDVTEANDDHADDLADFNGYCRQQYAEEYDGKWPIASANPGDKWWRRSYLYRNHVVNSFVKQMAERARSHGLKTTFCYYQAESVADSWRWGYDAVALETICDRLWVAAFGNLNYKFYRSFRDVWFDVGLMYRGQTPSYGMAAAFHGKALSFCDGRTCYFPDEVRTHIKRCMAKGSWPYGDYFNGYLGVSEKEYSLFYGAEQVRKWSELMKQWQPGESPANIAVGINPVPFIMKYPATCGKEYAKKALDLMSSLGRYMDVDGFVIGSEQAIQKAFLRKYSLIILPEDMTSGLSTPTYDLLTAYVKAGGSLLILKSPVITSRPDLTGQKDMTAELCGVALGEKTIGPVIIKSGIKEIIAPTNSMLMEKVPLVLKGAEAMAADGFSPCLTTFKLGAGKVYFSGVGFGPELAGYFASVIKNIAAPYISLEDSTGPAILVSVKKDEALCVSLFGAGQARLRVSAPGIGLHGNTFQVRDIVTGRVIAEQISSDQLAAGVDIKIAYVNQPMVVAIGARERLAAFTGLCPGDKVFEGMDKKEKLFENPEVPIAVPEGKGPRVGVYGNGAGRQAVMEALKNAGVRVFLLPRLESEALANADVVIIPQPISKIFFNQSKEDLRRYVNKGGGLLLLHDAVGYRDHAALFPEVGNGCAHPKCDKITILDAKQGIFKNLKPKELFTHAYADHVVLHQGTGTEVLAVDDQDNPVVIAGTFGTGRVILNGMATGISSLTPGSYDFKDAQPTGGELSVLLDSVQWLAKP